MKTTLDHVDDTTFSLMTLDGKEYKIELADVTICCAWTPTMELEIYKRGNQKYCKALATGATIRIR